MFGTVGLAPGTVVQGWKVVSELRAGGFGAVHQAEQHGKLFALKVARHREESGDTGRTHSRAEREVAVLLMMDHPNIIRPRGFGYLPDGRVYCVLEYVDGWTLGDWKERTFPTFREILRAFTKMAGALHYMDTLGVRHRDLKPSNVMIRRSDGEPVIIDLGCATYENAEELTTTPLPPGTDRYRPPQQREFLYKHGRKRGARYPFTVADELFAMGAMLYELLTLPLPAKDSPQPDFADPRLLPSPRAVNPRVPEALSALVEELLAYEPAQRPENFEALRRKLAELAEHQGPEYAAEAHPPSLQRQPAPGGGGQAAAHVAPARHGWRKVLAPAGEYMTRLGGQLQPRARAGGVADASQPWRKPRVLAGLVFAVMLAAGAAAWLARGAHPVPASPSAPAVSAPAATPAQDSAPLASPTAPKEGSTVKPKPSDAPKSPPTAGARQAAPAPVEPGTPAWCKRVALFVALAHPGCASVQLKAQPFECPPGAVEAMERLGWDIGGRGFPVTYDERGPRRGLYQYTVGAPVTGRVPDGYTGPVVPPGSLLHGRSVHDEKGTDLHPRGFLVIIYDHLEIPGKGKFPVCVVSETLPILKLKDGTATAGSSGPARPVANWEPGEFTR